MIQKSFFAFISLSLGVMCMLEQKSFYRINVNEDNIKDKISSINNIGVNNYFLIVNGCGCATTSFDFEGMVNYDYLLLFVEEGSLDIAFDSYTISVFRHQFIIIPPTTVFCIKKSQVHNTKCLWVKFTGTIIEQLLSNAIIVTKTGYIVKNHEEILTSFETLFNDFTENTVNEYGYWDMVTPAHLMLLIANLSKEKTVCQNNRKHQATTRIWFVLDYIQKHYTEEISIEDLAKLVHLSISRFRTVFKKTTGISPTTYIINMRLALARELLLCCSDSINSIAERCAFNSQSYMVRLFKQHFGMSPSEYRKKFKST